MSLPKKLQKIVLRDTGIKIDLPVSVNRGYWHTGEVYRWVAKEIGGNQRNFSCEDSMSACIRFGVMTSPRKPPQDWWGEWYFDVVTKPNTAFTRLGGTVAKNDNGEQPPSG